MKHVMIDLETLGNAPGCALLSLGAVSFDGEWVADEYYQRIDAESCVRAGLSVDVSTVRWWLGQSEEARAEVAGLGGNLKDVLGSFSEWLGMVGNGEKPCVWGNGASFDNACLAAAYRAVRLPLPWPFWNDRCYRTMKGLAPAVKMERGGVHHNALDDAKSQAEHLIAICREMGVKL